MSLPERIQWIDAQIRADRYPNADTVAEQFDVRRRTAFQDRKYLQDRLRAPIKTDRRRGGWYYTDPHFVLPALALPDAEAAALRRALLAAEEYLDAGEVGLVHSLLERLTPYLPERFLHESMGGSIRLSPALQFPPQLLVDCRRAIADRHRLFLRYYSIRHDAIGERIVRPYHLLYHRGELYLISWCEEKKTWRDFLLGRIRALEVLEPDAAFVRDPAFKIVDYLANGLGVHHGEEMVSVRARFSPYQSRWIRERQYHHSQKIEELPGGGLILTMQVAGTEEAQRWLLSYGGEVEVLEPLELRVAMAEEAKKLVNIYGLSAE